MLLINCEINITLSWNANCVISAATEAIKIVIIHMKLFFPLVTLSNKDNAKLLEQIKLGFKWTFDWKKYQ